MPFENFVPSNNAQGQLIAGISAWAGTMILQTGQGARFPSTFPYLCEIKQVDTIAPFAVLKREIVRVTGRTGDTLTIVRSAGTCLPDDTSNTPGTTAFSFSTGDIVTLTVTAETIKDIQDELMTKLPTAGGLRTGFWTNRHVRVNRTTGAEQSMAVTTGTSFDSTDILRVEQLSGDYKDVPYSALTGSLGTLNDISMIAWETLVQNDALIEEYAIIDPVLTTLQPKWLNVLMGNVTANTRISLGRVIWNWLSGSTIQVMVGKIGWPTDNCIIRIETDNGSGSPSGTLVNANATAQIAGWSITTGLVNTTFTFAGSFTMTDWVPYHIVAQRSAVVDPANHYFFGHYTITSRWFTTNVHNGTVWGTPLTTRRAYFNLAMAHTRLVVRGNASNSDSINFIGFAKAGVAIGAQVNVWFTGMCKTFSGLSRNTTYFLSNTAGAISTTPWTNPVAVWISDNTTQNIEIIPFSIGYVQSQNWFTERSISTVNGTALAILFVAERYMWLRVTANPGGSFNYSNFIINNNSITSIGGSWPQLIRPGDRVFLSFQTNGAWSYTVETSIINNYWPIFI